MSTPSTPTKRLFMVTCSASWFGFMAVVTAEDENAAARMAQGYVDFSWYPVGAQTWKDKPFITKDDLEEMDLTQSQMSILANATQVINVNWRKP